MVTLAARRRRVFTLTFGTLTVDIAIRQVTNANRISLIQQQLGLNKSTVILEGRMVDPREVPDELSAGSPVAPFVWAGRQGMIRVEPYQSAITGAWRQKYGDRVVMSWRSDEV